jgi:hypothetical protein
VADQPPSASRSTPRTISTCHGLGQSDFAGGGGAWSFVGASQRRPEGESSSTYSAPTRAELVAVRAVLGCQDDPRAGSGAHQLADTNSHTSHARPHNHTPRKILVN